MQNRLVLNARGRIQSLVAVETVKSICLPYLYLDLSIFCKSVHTMYWGQTWIAVFASQAAAVIYPPLFSKCSIKKDPEARVSTSNSSTLLLYLTLFVSEL